MRLTKWLSLLIVLVLLAGLTLPIVAQDDDDANAVTARAAARVNVRSGPGTAFDVLGLLEADDVVAVTGRSGPGNDWLRIDFRGDDGWVAFFLSLIH
ncbi:MAG: SH3 domain-containing protein, partial [Chloroflexi bacterium]|nr:SH3 domain-containing protein [Chloroflexota bacterium]